MLISVVGVGAHWLNLPMRLLHVQSMVKFFQIMALLGIMLDLQCTYPHDFIHTPTLSYCMYTLTSIHINLYDLLWIVPPLHSALFLTQTIDPTSYIFSVLPAFAPICA